jgi:xanthine dehydrogenase YagS FAD-binding subunit
MNPFEHVSAGSAAQAVALLRERVALDDTRLIAGGTDLLTLMQAGLLSPRRLVDLKGARDLRYLRVGDDGVLHIGALATLGDLERWSFLSQLPILLQSVRDAATPQLRAAATVAGNLLQRPRCWYFRGSQACWLKGGDRCFAVGGDNRYHAILGNGACVAAHPSDLAPALIAVDAELTIEGASGQRRIPVAKLFKQPDEDSRIEHNLLPEDVIVEIAIPRPSQHAGGVYLKVMERRAWSFALVSAAVQLSFHAEVVQAARIVMGGVSTIPWRAPAAEEMLLGRHVSEELAERAAETALEEAVPLTHNGYKVRMARELIRQAILVAGDYRDSPTLEPRLS